MKILNMNKARVFVLIIAIFLIGSSSCKQDKKAIESSQQVMDKANFIFFIADDMMPDMFNCLPQGEGRNLTPNLDRLAAEGTVMMKQYVVSPVCTPSRYNCLTGKYASRATNDSFIKTTENNEGQTAVQWNSHVTSDDKILPQYLQEAGYATGMVGKNHVIEAKGFQRYGDFFSDPRSDENQKITEENYNKVTEAIKARGFDFADGIYHNNPYGLGLDELAVHNLDWTTEAGLRFIEQNHDKPFFLYFATTVPHGPGEPKRSWNADPTMSAAGILEKAPDVLPERHTIPERIEAAGLKNKGRENLLWLDDALGALLQKLEEHDLLDNTIIFFFNDHGQLAKGTLYEGGTRNPSIIWAANGFPTGSISNEQITNVDFAPTILDLAGIDYPVSDFDGLSFRKVLYENKPASRESLYFEMGFGRAVIKGKFKYYAIRYPEYATDWTITDRTKALERYNKNRRAKGRNIVNEDPEKPFSHISLLPGGGDAEHRSYGKKPAYFELDQLYDLEADPDEQKNLAADPNYQDVLIEMKAELQKYIDKLPGKFEL